MTTKTYDKLFQEAYKEGRTQARTTRQAVHLWDKREPHVTNNDELCWCDPNCEDFTQEGAGILILHNSVKTWH